MERRDECKSCTRDVFSRSLRSTPEAQIVCNMQLQIVASFGPPLASISSEERNNAAHHHGKEARHNQRGDGRGLLPDLHSHRGRYGYVQCSIGSCDTWSKVLPLLFIA